MKLESWDLFRYLPEQGHRPQQQRWPVGGWSHPTDDTALPRIRHAWPPCSCYETFAPDMHVVLWQSCFLSQCLCSSHRRLAALHPCKDPFGNRSSAFVHLERRGLLNAVSRQQSPQVCTNQWATTRLTSMDKSSSTKRPRLSGRVW